MNSSPKIQPSVANPRAVSLRLIVVFVSCCAIALGLIWHWPGVMPIAAVVLVVIVARTWTLLRAAGISPAPPRWKVWALSLVGSLGVVSLAGATSAAVFVSVCFPLGATQFNYPEAESAVPILGGASWVLGGVAAAMVATIILDATWLEPLAIWARHQRLPTLRERTRGLFRVAVPPLSGMAIGGMCALFPAALAVMTGPLQALAAAALFIACLAGFLGGGWLGLMATKKSLAGMAALLAIGIGMLTSWFTLLQLESILRQDPYLRNTIDVGSVGSIVAIVIFGVGAAVSTWLTVRWTDRTE